MKKLLILVVLCSSVSCISVQRTVSQHVYSNTKLPEIKSEGKACSYNVLGFWHGDMTVDAAAKSANITEISFVESKTEVYPLYTKLCTIVKGK